MLEIKYADVNEAPVELVAPGKTIGQGVANDIVIDKDGINGFHADIQFDGDVVSIPISIHPRAKRLMVRRLPVPRPCVPSMWSLFRAPHLRLSKQPRLSPGKPSFLSLIHI